MIDTSLEAIEQDIITASAGGVNQTERLIAIHRAGVRATLRGQVEVTLEGDASPVPDLVAAPVAPGQVDCMIIPQPNGKTYVVPMAANPEDLIEVAADILGVDPEDLDRALKPIDDATMCTAGVDPDGDLDGKPDRAQEDADLWEQARRDREA